jgi:hypothetical protein
MKKGDKKMIYREITKDLFSVSDEYVLTHCISSDFALGAGIAKDFAAKYNVKNELMDKFPTFEQFFSDNRKTDRNYGCCIKTTSIRPVYNLVTKQCYYNKPTLLSLKESLMDMKEQMQKDGVKKIAMPQIGCGLDKLNWQSVSTLIKVIFEKEDVEIIVCKK